MRLALALLLLATAAGFAAEKNIYGDVIATNLPAATVRLKPVALVPVALTNSVGREVSVLAEFQRQPAYPGSLLGEQKQAALTAYRQTKDVRALETFNTNVNRLKP